MHAQSVDPGLFKLEGTKICRSAGENHHVSAEHHMAIKDRTNSNTAR